MGMDNIDMNCNFPQFGITQQGRPRLFFQGFSYNFNSGCGTAEYWRCAMKNCKGWVVKRDNIYRLSKAHTCINRKIETFIPQLPLQFQQSKY